MLNAKMFKIVSNDSLNLRKNLNITRIDYRINKITDYNFIISLFNLN